MIAGPTTTNHLQCVRNAFFKLYLLHCILLFRQNSFWSPLKEIVIFILSLNSVYLLKNAIKTSIVNSINIEFENTSVLKKQIEDRPRGATSIVYPNMCKARATWSARTPHVEHRRT